MRAKFERKLGQKRTSPDCCILVTSNIHAVWRGLRRFDLVGRREPKMMLCKGFKPVANFLLRKLLQSVLGATNFLHF